MPRLSAMAISDRTRKILWTKTAARCCVCRVPVAGEKTDTDDPSVFGEEAHIVARSAGGPRWRVYAGDIDGYDNLLLLCSKCHKQIDDQVNAYTEDRLLEIKRDHEAWAAKLGEKPDPGPTRLVPDPAHPTPKMLKLFMDGTSFWHYVARSYQCQPSWPTGLSEEHLDLIHEFLQDMQDWIDIDDHSYSMARDASKSLNRHITDLIKAGFLVGARRRHFLLTGGVDAAPVPWVLIEVEIQPASVAELVDEDGKPIRFETGRVGGRGQ